MADVNRTNSAKLPLVEAVIIIALFAVISVALMSMYVSADRLRKKAVNTSEAMLCAENIAEKIKAEGRCKLPAGYDIDWNEVTSDPEFVLTVFYAETKGETGVYLQAEIVIATKDGEILSELKTATVI